MLKGWKTYLGIGGAVLTAAGALAAGELSLVQFVITLFGAVGIGGIRAKLGRDKPATAN